MASIPNSILNFSDHHMDLIERDSAAIMGWRYEPKVIFSGGIGSKLIDVDGNEYYDVSSGMMCLVLGHAHPENEMSLPRCTFK